MKQRRTWIHKTQLGLGTIVDWHQKQPPATANWVQQRNLPKVTRNHKTAQITEKLDKSDSEPQTEQGNLKEGTRNHELTTGKPSKGNPEPQTNCFLKTIQHAIHQQAHTLQAPLQTHLQHTFGHSHGHSACIRRTCLQNCNTRA